jgi:hypothetical protein
LTLTRLWGIPSEPFLWRNHLAFKAVNLTKTIKYESDLDSDKGTEAATKFILGAIDSRTWSHVVDTNMESKMTQDGEQLNKFNQMTVAYNIVRFGLKGFENFLDDENKELVYKTEKFSMAGKAYMVTTEEIMSLLPVNLIMELAGEINSINTVSEEDSKN